MSIFEFERVLIAILIIMMVGIAATGGYLWYVEKQEIPLTTIGADKKTDEAIILSGVYTCLQKVGTNIRQADCLSGVTTGEGLVFGLAMERVIEAGGSLDLEAGEEIVAGGHMLPDEDIDTETWNGYALEGVLQVEEIAKQ